VPQFPLISRVLPSVRLHSIVSRSLPSRFVGAVTAVVLGLAVFFLPSVAHAKSVSKATAQSEAQVLEVPGQPSAYYYRPQSRDQKHIIMFLHGRGGNAAEDCRKWARAASLFGWVVCPQGPDDRGGGSRTWANNPVQAQAIIDATVLALKEKFKSRVRTRGNILIGFSEGAFIAMQVGLKEPKVWDRWLILGASDQYWMNSDTKAALEESRKKIRRVYLLTGENDGVAENTKRAGDMLLAAKIPVKVRIMPGMGHEVPSDRMITTYRRPLRWLVASSK
jgi:predicted esterase